MQAKIEMYDENSDRQAVVYFDLDDFNEYDLEKQALKQMNLAEDAECSLFIGDVYIGNRKVNLGSYVVENLRQDVDALYTLGYSRNNWEPLKQYLAEVDNDLYKVIEENIEAFAD